MNTDFETAEREKANLEYAKKTTDLILDPLKNQAHNPDQELLDRMNWTQQDMLDFIERWEQMKNAAQTGDLKAQERYKKKLKSLGMTPDLPGGRVQADRDDQYGLSEDGAVNRAPQQWSDKFQSYMKRRNKVQPQ